MEETTMEKLNEDIMKNSKDESLKAMTRFGNNEALIKKMKDAFMDCPTAKKYIASLKVEDEVIDKNINKIYDFVSDINACKKCPGMSKCTKNNPYLVTKIIYVDGILDRQLVPCKELVKRNEFLHEFRIRDFEDSWLESKIRTLDSSNARAKALKKYSNYVKSESASWIYLVGEQNSGRSYLAATFAVDLANRKKGPICYINTAKRVKELSDAIYKNNERFQRLMELYSTCDVLVFDDFGNEFKNDLIRDSIIFEIISKRSAAHLFTIFTSDFSIDDIVTLYSTSKSAALRAKQIGRLIKNNAQEEINLGEMSIY